MPDTPSPIRVNRAPVLTLGATVVAERLGYPPETALTLGRFVAGSSARAKARRLGISDEKQEAEERHARAAELKPRRQTVRLLGRDIPVLAADDGTLRAEDDGKPASAKSVASYIARAFGDRLGEARTAMETLAASLPPEEVNRVGFRLYERFRPVVPEGAQGWGAKGELRVEQIVGVAGLCALSDGRHHCRGKAPIRPSSVPPQTRPVYPSWAQATSTRTSQSRVLTNGFEWRPPK
jgi:hypothetical protein